MYTVVNDKDFGLNGSRACISGLRNKEKYKEYQDSYREEYGVYPELDRIHNPYTARWDDVYNMCCTLRKSGVYDALYFHDLHARYRKRLRHIYENYSREWPFLTSINLEHRTVLTDIPLMSPTESIADNLGYRKDEQGNYYEGTFQNGQLIYGLVYLAKQDIFFVGSFDESGRSDCRGVAIDLGEEKKGKRQVNTTIGDFRLKNGELSLYNSTCLINLANIKNGEFLSLDSYAGQYADGYAEGTFLNKVLSDDIRIRWDKYKDGEVKSSLSYFELIPRTLMMFYMLVWYLVKYVHGCLFLVTPLYYYFRKKSWRI